MIKFQAETEYHFVWATMGHKRAKMGRKSKNYSSKMTIWPMHNEYWISKSTNTLSQHVILIVLHWTMVAQMHLNVTSNVHWLSCVFYVHPIHQWNENLRTTKGRHDIRSRIEDNRIMSSLFSGLFQVAQYGKLRKINRNVGSVSCSCYFTAQARWDQEEAGNFGRRKYNYFDINL